MNFNKIEKMGEDLPIVYSTKSPSETHSSEKAFERLVIRMNSVDQIESMRKKNVFWKYCAIAASVTLLIGLCYYWIEKEEIPEMKVLSTIAGQAEQFTLPDGSIVWINADTRLLYPEKFTRKCRQVYISGEAYFEISKDVSRPFIVKTDRLDVVVLGTKFNVKSYPDEPTIETTLVEGSVKIQSNEKSSTTILRPNQQLILRKSNGKLSLYDNINLKHYIGWTSGQLYFRQSSIEDVTKKLERAFNVKIHIESEKLRKRRFTGRIDENESIEEILKAIQLTTPYNYSIDSNVIILRDK